MAEEKEETTAVDPMEEKKETTAVESDDHTIFVQSKVCPVATLFCAKEKIGMRECISNCAWYLTAKRKAHEGGCSIMILAQTFSDLKAMAKTRNWGR